MYKAWKILICPAFIALSMAAVSPSVQAREAMLPVKAQFLSAYEQSGTLEEIDMALELSIAPPWYSYWRVAGDAGLPPVFDWSESRNVAALDLYWPAPKRFETMGLHSFGYDGDILFPVRVRPEIPGEDMTIRLKADLMVCDTICIPQKIELERRFRAGGGVQDSLHKPRILAGFAKLPYTGAQADMAVETSVLAAGALSFVLHDRNGIAGDADLIIESDSVAITTPPLITIDPQDPTRAVARIKATGGQDFTQTLFGKKVGVLFLNKGRALEQEISF